MQATASQRPHRSIMFQALPFDLREHIYELLATTTRLPFDRSVCAFDEEANSRRSPGLPPWPLSIWHVNEATRVDVILSLLRSMAFAVNCQNSHFKEWTVSLAKKVIR